MSQIPPPSTHAATVLVVTPDPELRSLACGMLHFSGYRTAVATTPRQAVNLVEEHGVEGIFFDVEYGGFSPALLLRPPESQDVHESMEWLRDREDLSGRRHLFLCGRRPPAREYMAEAASLGRSVSFLGRPFGLHDFRVALAAFTAEHVPSPARAAGATGTLLAVPSPQDVAPPAGYEDPRAGRYGTAQRRGRGTEHRLDLRFEWTCSAVILGREEEPAEICEISRAGLRIRKAGRELSPGSQCELSFVTPIHRGRERGLVGIRALGDVVWSAEGMTHIEAGITLRTVQPLADYISLLVSLYAASS